MLNVMAFCGILPRGVTRVKKQVGQKGCAVSLSRKKKNYIRIDTINRERAIAR